MNSTSAHITFLWLAADDSMGCQIETDRPLNPQPGQYLLANAPALPDALPVVLFPIGRHATELRIAAPIPAPWRVGLQLVIRGPLGHGFNLPATARRIALCAPWSDPARLLPLASLGLQQGAAIVLHTNLVPTNLSPEVEVLPLEQLVTAPAWADFLALEAPLSKLSELRQLVGAGAQFFPGCPCQVLVHTEMPCGTLAACGVCAVSTRSGWKRTCSDGPVFDFNQLEL